MIVGAALIGFLLPAALVGTLLAVLIATMPGLPRSLLSVWGPPLALVVPLQAAATLLAAWAIWQATQVGPPSTFGWLKTGLTALVAGTPAGIVVGVLYAWIAFLLGLANADLRGRAPWLWPSAAVGMGLSAAMLVAAFGGFVALRAAFPD